MSRCGFLRLALPVTRLTVVLLLAVPACQRPQTIEGRSNCAGDRAPSFQERTPESQGERSRQPNRGTLLIYLQDAGPGGAPISDANIRLYRGDAVGAGVGLRGGTMTDATGLAMIDSLSPRQYRVDIRRIGYLPVSGRVEIVAGRVHIIDAALVRNLCAPGAEDARTDHRYPRSGAG